ncbi:MAG: SOS response-associated peptidase [Hyphomicrobiales bacterium]|uniref:SOS response-associated peptidase n=1 Tax=Aestuariivirga sp. TaxID=2650926 RepID=UPI0035AE7510
MCGLYSLSKSPRETKAWFRYHEDAEFPPRAHVAPGQPIGVVRMENGERHFALVRWGFIPAWVKEVKPGKPLINARGETVMEKPSFRNAMRRRRCLVPADGYYEWSGPEGRKVPFFVQRPDRSLFALAGLWEHWMGADGSELETATLMTIAPNDELAAIHDRMPVIIAPDDYETWLTGETEDAAKLIRPAPDGSFVMEPTTIGRAAAPKPPPKKPDQMSLF